MIWLFWLCQDISAEYSMIPCRTCPASSLDLFHVCRQCFSGVMNVLRGAFVSCFVPATCMRMSMKQSKHLCSVWMSREQAYAPGLTCSTTRKAVSELQQPAAEHLSQVSSRGFCVACIRALCCTCPCLSTTSAAATMHGEDSHRNSVIKFAVIDIVPAGRAK